MMVDLLEPVAWAALAGLCIAFVYHLVKGSI